MNKSKQLLSFMPEPLRDCYLNYKDNKELKNWEKKGCPIPAPHIVKQIIIKSYQEKYNIDILIETGTYFGDMVYAQRKNFKEIYSIELSKQLHEFCIKRLKRYKNIHLLQGDSGVILDSIVNNIKKRAIFWLDGHYSGGVTAKGEKECPIIQELQTILSSKFEHIILIDDARDFKGNHEYPSIEELKDIIKNSAFTNSHITNKDDVIRIELKL